MVVQARWVRSNVPLASACLPACLIDVMCMQSAVMNNQAELDQLTWAHNLET